jgi:hypothetical protein
MSDEVRVTAKRREPIDLDALGMALLEVVEGLDAKTRGRLAKAGAKLLKAGEVSAPLPDEAESAA